MKKDNGIAIAAHPFRNNNRISNVTMTTFPDLFSLIILKAGNYAVKYGNTEMA
ncbi:MAG: hypothetical protein GXY88_02235, partial [Tissierellia bacterium]|nr:hypothetical protein [Tissierellia bacterium]